MWNKIQYALIYSWVKVHALLPMWALYILSDILYVLVYKVVRYRVKVVRQNMKASFPDKSDTELRRLEREFYHHFADYVVETIKLAHISLEELQRRAFLKNPELVDTLMEKGHTCFYPPDGTLRQLGMVFRLDFPFQGFPHLPDIPTPQQPGIRSPVF